jgi:hypothetical protein
MPPLERFKRLDVRPLLAKFLPSPLIEFLGSEGFQSKVERGQGSDWLVYFWKD